MMNMVLFISPFLWLLRLAVLLVFAAIGVPLIAVLAWCRVYRLRFSPQFGRDVTQFPRIFGLWSNAEDGVDGLRGGDPAQRWWAERTAGWSPARRIFVWSAFRNPVNNLRYVPLLNPRLHPGRIPSGVRSIGAAREMQDGQTGYYFAWLGLYSCIRWEFRVPQWIVWLSRFTVRITMRIWPTAFELRIERLPIDPSPVYMRLWLGWKLKPEDAAGIAPNDTRLPRADFAAQLKRVA